LLLLKLLKSSPVCNNKNAPNRFAWTIQMMYCLFVVSQNAVHLNVLIKLRLQENYVLSTSRLYPNKVIEICGICGICGICVLQHSTHPFCWSENLPVYFSVSLNRYAKTYWSIMMNDFTLERTKTIALHCLLALLLKYKSHGQKIF